MEQNYLVKLPIQNSDKSSMDVLFPSNAESLTQRTLLFLRMLGSTCIAAVIAWLVLVLFSYAVPEGLFTNSNCDSNCSHVLIVSGYFMIIPYVFVLLWATFTYLMEIILQKKLTNAPRRLLGYSSIMILIAGGIASYNIHRRVEFSVVNYIKAVGDWRTGSLTKETIASFNAVQKFLKTKTIANLNGTSEH